MPHFARHACNELWFIKKIKNKQQKNIEPNEQLFTSSIEFTHKIDRVKLKSTFEHAQNEQIHIILRIREV